MKRSERIASEPNYSKHTKTSTADDFRSSFAPSSPNADDCDNDDQNFGEKLMMQISTYSASEHTPLESIVELLNLNVDYIDLPSLTYILNVLQSRHRSTPLPEGAENENFRRCLHSLSRIDVKKAFPKMEGKNVITPQQLTKCVQESIPEGIGDAEKDAFVSSVVRFILYDNKDKCRVCDLDNYEDMSLRDPEETDQRSTLQSNSDADITGGAEYQAKLDAIMARIEEAERLASNSITDEEVAKVVSFLDPNNDGVIDIHELESAFRSSRKDASVGEKIDLEEEEKKLKVMEEKLKVLMEPEIEVSAFSDQEIAKVVAFMDPNRDGITTDEFEKGFRSARRARANKEAELKGREALSKLADRIKEVHPDFKENVEWFNLCNTNPGPPGSPVEVTGLELREGLKSLGGFKKGDVDAMLKYMDPDGDCDLTVPEFEGAFEKLGRPPEADAKAAEAGEIVVRLEVHMDEANIRMIDLFRMMDKDGEGSIEPDELKAGLNHLARPSGAVRAKKKIEKNKMIKTITQKQKKQKFFFDLEKRRVEAEESGAGEVLRMLEVQMHKKGQRMADLFREIDKSGDGAISRGELLHGLKSLCGPTARMRAEQKRAIEQQEEHLKKVQKKHEQEVALRERIVAAEESGAASVLGRLYELLTDGVQEKKIADVFREYDASGEGELSHGEMKMALDLLNMEMTDQEIKDLLLFLDGNGDGSIDLMELDSAMREFIFIRRKNKDFGTRSNPRMTAENLSLLAANIMEKYEEDEKSDNRLTAGKLHELFHSYVLESTSETKYANPEIIRTTKKHKEWLDASRLSRAPTGRLPSLEDKLTEAQILEIETAKLKLKKEREVAGEVHFNHWLKKKLDTEKILTREKMKDELEKDGIVLPPIEQTTLTPAKFEKLKAEHKEKIKAEKKEEGESAWEMWSRRKAAEMKEAKRQRRKEYKEAQENQKKEFERLRAERKKKYEADMIKYGVKRGGGSSGDDGSTIGGTARSRRSRMSRKSNKSMNSLMSGSVTLSLCEASISPYAVNNAAPYPKRFTQLKEQLKQMKLAQLNGKNGEKIPKSWTMEAEAFRDEILGIPRHVDVGGPSGGYDDASIAASSLSGDGLSVGDDSIINNIDNISRKGKADRGMISGGGGLGKPPLSVKRPQHSTKKNRQQKKPKKGAEGVGDEGDDKGSGKLSSKGGGDFLAFDGGDGEDAYGDDFEGGDDFPVVISSFDGDGDGAEEKDDNKSIDFFNADIVSDLPTENEAIDVYGDDFEEDIEELDEKGGTGELILATAPPPGHFSMNNNSRPNTSGGGSVGGGRRNNSR